MKAEIGTCLKEEIKELKIPMLIFGLVFIGSFFISGKTPPVFRVCLIVVVIFIWIIDLVTCYSEKENE